MSGTRKIRRSTRISDAAEHGAAAKKWELAGGPGSQKVVWSEDETKSFFIAFHRYGPSWAKVAKAVGQYRTPEQCEALYKQHQGYLNLDKKLQNEVVFLTMIRDHYNNLKKETDANKDDSDTISDDGAVGNGSIVSGGDSAHRPGSMRTRRTPRQSAKAKAAAETTPRSNKVLPRSVGSGGAQRRVRGHAEIETVKTSPIESPMSKRKRAKRLQFGEDATETTRYAGAVQYLRNTASTAVFPTEPEHLGDGSESSRPHVWRRLEEANNEDEEKGADALLSLASLIHASSSGVTELDHRDGTEGYDMNLGPLHRPQSHQLQNLQQTQHYWTAVQPESFVVLQPYTHPREGQAGRYTTANALFQRPLANVAPDAFVRHQSVPEMSIEQGTTGLNHLEDQLQTQGGDGIGNTAGTQGDSSHLQDSTATATSKQKSSEPAPRQRRRKPIPEKLPPMVSPIKSLFLRRASFNNIQSQHVMNMGLAGMHMDPEGLMIQQHPAELRLRHVLNPKIRRWCMYEFMYSALDRPWFMQNELQDFLNHLGLGSITMLTRLEWSLVRGALGKPRRLSLKFLKEERAKLEKWREGLRAQYDDIGRGNIDGIPPYLPRPLSVGQKVTARHPITRQIHDGQVLTVEHNSYRVQFDRRELGVEMVRDIDVMPINPLDTLPPHMLQTQGPLLVLNGHSFGNTRQRGSRGRPGWGAPSRGPMAASSMQQQLRVSSTENAQREQLAASIAAVNGALEKKEALLVQLRSMNDEVESGVTDINSQQSLPFKLGYSQVVFTLNQVNQDLDTSMVHLEDMSGAPGGSTAEGGTLVLQPTAEVVGGDDGRQGMVGGAGARHGGLEGEEATQGGDALPLTTTAWVEAQGVVERIKRQLNIPSDGVKIEQLAAEVGDSSAPGSIPDSERTIGDSSAESKWLSQLITGCLTVFIILQQCADGDMHSEAVRQALDSAMLFVRPHAHANQALYSQIQESIDHLKSQLV